MVLESIGNHLIRNYSCVEKSGKIGKQKLFLLSLQCKQKTKLVFALYLIQIIYYEINIFNYVNGLLQTDKGQHNITRKMEVNAS